MSKLRCTRVFFIIGFKHTKNVEMCFDFYILYSCFFASNFLTMNSITEYRIFFKYIQCASNFGSRATSSYYEYMLCRFGELHRTDSLANISPWFEKSRSRGGTEGPYSALLQTSPWGTPKPGILKYRDTRIQGYRDTGIQEYTGIQGHRNKGIQGYSDTGIQGYRDTGIQGYRDTGIRGYT